MRLAPYTLETGLVLEILREDSSFFCSKPSEDRGRQISVDIIFPSFLALWDPRFMQELAFSVWLGPKNYLLFPELYSLLKPDFGSPEIGRYPLGQILAPKPLWIQDFLMLLNFGISLIFCRLSYVFEKYF